MSAKPLVSVITASLNGARHLEACLDSVARQQHVTVEHVVIDGGSNDGSVEILQRWSPRLAYWRSEADAGIADAMNKGLRQARGEWLLFLHADTVLSPGWEEEVSHYVSQNYAPAHAGVFRFALDDFRPQARRLERMVALRCKLLALPYGDQGLLIHRSLYDQIGGYAELPLMEDVDLIRRIGRKRLIYFRSTAQTSATRYITDGYLRRPLRNLLCLSLFFLRVPPRHIARLYG